MKNFKIKITGSGTQDEILRALTDVVNDIRAMGEEYLAEGHSWEDATIFTEIYEYEDEEL